MSQVEVRIYSCSYTAFGIMLLGIPIREAINLLTDNRARILEEKTKVDCENLSCP